MLCVYVFSSQSLWYRQYYENVHGVCSHRGEARNRVHWVALQAQEYRAQALVGAEEHVVQESVQVEGWVVYHKCETPACQRAGTSAERERRAGETRRGL